ncbi:MAG: hypothetical protein EOP50_13065 [Sphingobacteriales bacterium]|nr:MAG: hypothetical protein EOP50_13065 [Sphingobacteriales bacterium]
MRSIWFALIGPSIAEVEEALEACAFLRTPGLPNEFRHPSIDEPNLYVRCTDYQWVEEYELHEEYAELLEAIGEATPTVYVGADVSGRIPGDSEVRLLAQCLLKKFPGFAFDDFLAYSHAWTLQEIEGDAVFGQLHFFDYKGHWRLYKSRSDQR